MGPFSDPMGNMGGMGGDPFGLMPQAQAQPNLGFGSMAPGGMNAWGGMISTEELERIRRLREAAMRPMPQGGDYGAFNDMPMPPPAPTTLPPLPTRVVGTPPVPPAPPGPPAASAVPYGPAMPSPDALREGKLDGRTMFQQAGDWMTRNFGGGLDGKGQDGGQAMRAMGGMGARMAAPPAEQPMRLSPMQTPGYRPQARAGSLPIKPGRMDMRRQAQQPQRRRGILDE